MRGKGSIEKTGTPVSATAEQRIFLIRGQAVMMDSHLAGLYGVETRTLIQAVKRNSARFPADFMFPINDDEYDSLKSQFVMSKNVGRGGRRTLPYVFTEQGVAMLSSVLRSEKAVQVNIEIMRAFVRMKRALLADKELARRMETVENTVDTHGKRIGILSDIVRGMIDPPTKPKRKIGFRK